MSLDQVDHRDHQASLDALVNLDLEVNPDQLEKEDHEEILVNLVCFH